MSFAQVLNFNGPSGFNSSGVTVGASGAKLTLIDNPAQVFSQDFASSSGFTYDSAKAEFTGGLVRQKDQRPTNAVCGATYTTTKDLNWSVAGALTATDTGSPVLSSGKLQCRGGGNNSVRYDNADIGGIAGNFALKLKYTPQYSGTPAGDRNIAELALSSGNANRVVFHHRTTGGTIVATIYDDSGSIVHNQQAMGSAWSPTSGTEYELEFNIDSSTGMVRLFIDGVLKGSVSATTVFTRGTSATRLYIGAGTLIATADADYDDVLLFSAVQHTSGYTPGYTVSEYIYLANKVDGPAFSYTGVGTVQSVDDGTVTSVGSPRYIIAGFYWDGAAWVFSNGSYAQANDFATILAHLEDFVASGGTLPWSVVFTDSNTLSSVDDFSIEVTGQKYTLDGYVENIQAVEASELLDYEDTRTTPALTGIRVIIIDDGTMKYHNGSAWVNSDGSYAQANVPADVVSNIANLDLGENSTVHLRWVFNTSNAQATPTLTDATLTYEFGAVETIPDRALCYAYVRDLAGNPIQGAKINIALSLSAEQYLEASDNIIMNGGLNLETDDNGYFSTNLIRSSSLPADSNYVLTITKGDAFMNKDGTDSIVFTVPDTVETLDLTSRLPAA